MLLGPKHPAVFYHCWWAGHTLIPADTSPFGQSESDPSAWRWWGCTASLPAAVVEVAPGGWWDQAEGPPGGCCNLHRSLHAAHLVTARCTAGTRAWHELPGMDKANCLVQRMVATRKRFPSLCPLLLML